MVFITLGTQGNQFPRCLQMVDNMINELHPKDHFVAQVGLTKYKTDNIETLSFVSETDYKLFFEKADVVITHAGSGALFNAIRMNKKTIAVARLHKYNEMTNDHQTELVRKLSQEGYILDGTYSVTDAWKKLDTFIPRKCDFECTLVNEISNLLSDWLK